MSIVKNAGLTILQCVLSVASCFARVAMPTGRRKHNAKYKSWPYILMLSGCFVHDINYTMHRFWKYWNSLQFSSFTSTRVQCVASDASSRGTASEAVVFFWFLVTGHWPPGQYGRMGPFHSGKWPPGQTFIRPNFSSSQVFLSAKYFFLPNVPIGNV